MNETTALSSWPPSSTNPVVVAEALRLDDARVMQQVDATEALSLWNGLVSGELSIVEAKEADGRRILVARRNRADEASPARLTSEESAVLWLASEGRSLKYIAYELDLSIAIVVRRLKRATQKLGLSSRRELLQKLGAPAQ